MATSQEKKTRQQVWIKQLTIHKYKNVQSGTVLHFNDKCNVILGKNATGKTTLLELISRCASGIPFIRQIEEVDIQFEFRYGITSLNVHQCILKVNERSQPTGSAGLLTESLPDVYSTTLQIRVTQPNEFTLSLNYSKGEVDVTLEHQGETHKEHLMNINIDVSVGYFFPVVFQSAINLKQKNISNRVLELASKFWSNEPLSRFDEALDTFHKITSDSEQLNSPRIRLQIREVVNDQEGQPPKMKAMGAQSTNIPRDILMNILKSSQASSSMEYSLSFTNNEIGFLEKIRETIGMERVRMTLSLLKSSEDKGDVKSGFLSYGKPEFLFTDHHGNTRRHSELSFGQKRILAFYYYYSLHPDMVIADEIVNGLHHAWIENVMTSLEDRQCFLTSQNPLLLNYIGLFSIKDLQERMIFCKLKDEKDCGVLTWDNISEEDASEVVGAYAQKIEKLGDILLSRGMW